MEDEFTPVHANHTFYDCPTGQSATFDYSSEFASERKDARLSIFADISWDTQFGRQIHGAVLAEVRLDMLEVRGILR
jgi:hypothetical protein